MDNAKKQSTTRRTLHYFWAATKRHLGLFVALVVSTVFFSGLLTYGSPFVIGTHQDGHIFQGIAVLLQLTNRARQPL